MTSSGVVTAAATAPCNGAHAGILPENKLAISMANEAAFHKLQLSGKTGVN